MKTGQKKQVELEASARKRTKRSSCLSNCQKNSEVKRWKTQVTTNERRKRRGLTSTNTRGKRKTAFEFAWRKNCEDAAFQKEGGMSGVNVA